ncbi:MULTISPECIES: hypothetical protein [Sphingobacterium]|uniref:hypothetical protein n=1 Tax=Sphingobacterium TaxID=28453 RepID=UPI00257C24E3|nr:MULTISPECIES: hypothetical protein [Sphingobacterium]
MEQEVKYAKIINVLFILCTFILTRQFPLMLLSPLMNVCVVMLVVFSLANNSYTVKDLRLIAVLVFLPLAINFLYSIFVEHNSIGNASRFFLILVFIAFAYGIRVNINAVRAFVILHVIQVFVLLGVFLVVSLFLGFEGYLPLRAFFLEKGWGDVYSYTGYLYKIQLKGNALILFSFFIASEFPLFKRTKLIVAILLLGVFLSGNFTFICIAFAYLLFRFLNWNNFTNVNKYLLCVLAVVMVLVFSSPFIVDYVLETLEMKSDESLATRGDQINVLLQDWGKDLGTMLLGGGLGNTMNEVTAYRDYRGEVYFELQSIYVFNQLGLLFSLPYFFYNIMIVFKRWSSQGYIVLIYILYLIYAFSNPYLLDTNQFLVIIVLNSIYVWREKNILAGTSVH